MKILAFPFAGGNKQSLNFYNKFLPESVEFIPFDYPGRGTRVRENLLDNVDAVVEDAFKAISPYINNHEDYIIYGHSMGGLISYLLAHKIRDENKKLPLKLIVSGRSAPSKERERTITHNLPTELFWKEVFSLNGTPEAFMDDPQLKEYFEPIIRADFKVVEEYSHQEKPALDIPVDVFYGSEELKYMGDINLWKKESNRLVTIRELKGDHFFIFEHGEYIAKHITDSFFQGRY